MATFWSFVLTAAGSFGLGYWVAGHPADARNLLQRVRDALGRLIHHN